MRTFLRSNAKLLVLAFAVVLAIPAIALADVVQSDVVEATAGQKVVSVQAGQTTSDIGYRINDTGGDTTDTSTASQNCNPEVKAAELTLSGLPSGVAVKDTSGNALTAPHLTFTQCDTYQYVKLAVGGSVPAGDYTVSVADITNDGYVSNDFNENAATFTLRVTAATATNHAPTVSTAALDASGNEGSQLTTSGAFSDQDGDNLNISIVSGAGQVQEGTTDGTWSWSYTPNDNGSGTVVVQASDGTDTVTDSFDWTANNVPPTVSSVTPSVSNALVNRNVTFTGTATDPSSADTTAGFFWQFSTDGTNYSPATIPSPFASNSNQFTTSFSSCGTKSVSAKATDKDAGTSAAASGSVSVYNASYLSPLNEGMNNTVQAGRVVPVKISVGCLSSLTGLSPSIQLLKGDQSAGAETGDDAVETLSVSSADTTGFMRAIDGGYIYNLQVPSTGTKAGDLLTVRVNPFATQANPNPAGSAMYIVLKIRK